MNARDRSDHAVFSYGRVPSTMGSSRAARLRARRRVAVLLPPGDLVQLAMNRMPESSIHPGDASRESCRVDQLVFFLTLQHLAASATLRRRCLGLPWNSPATCPAVMSISSHPAVWKMRKAVLGELVVSSSIARCSRSPAARRWRASHGCAPRKPAPRARGSRPRIRRPFRLGPRRQQRSSKRRSAALPRLRPHLLPAPGGRARYRSPPDRGSSIPRRARRSRPR